MRFNFLKKKSLDVPPMPQNNVANDISLMNDIPLPPKKEVEEPVSIETESSLSQPVSEPLNSEQDFQPAHIDQDFMDQDFNEDQNINAPLTKEQEAEDIFKHEEDEKNRTPNNNEEELDFSLPDFSNEEMNLKDFNSEPEETEVPETIEKKEADVDVLPVQRELPTKVELVKFLDMTICKKIYNHICYVQEEIERCFKAMQKLDSQQKSVLQNHQTLHDDLDIAQEKLMEIDKTLFEG